MEAVLQNVLLEVLTLLNCILKNERGPCAHMPPIGVFLWQGKQEDVAVVPCGPPGDRTTFQKEHFWLSQRGKMALTHAWKGHQTLP